jgi:Tol biopolymer transport system component/DNA-binding winged helix-turn-helix (wHTH) protein
VAIPSHHQDAPHQDAHHHDEFGPFRLDRTARLLFRNADTVALAPKTFDLLALLVGNPGRAMSKREIVATLWPDTAVEEGNLSFQISTLRKALGPEGSKWVETVPRHGYRFRAPEAIVTSRPATRPHPAWRLWIAAAAGFAIVITGAALLVRGREPLEPATSVPFTTYKGSETAPSFSPDGKAVAFMWDNGDNGKWDIYVKLRGIEAPRRFTSSPESDVSPAWSPDGHMIAFVRRLHPDSVQYIVKPYPEGPERILMTVANCAAREWVRLIAWHPGGRHLIVPEPKGEQSCGLAALSIGNGAMTSLIEPPPRQTDFEPAVSPDGRTLAFVRGAGYPDLALYAVHLSQELKPTGPAWRVTSETARMESGPAWMPDSRELVYSRGNSVSDFALFRVASSGAGKPQPVRGAGPLSFWPSISTQGGLVFAAGACGDASLWSVELPRDAGDAPVLTEVAPSSHMQQSPRYSPDGERIVFESERSGRSAIWTISTTGEAIQQLTDSAAVAQSPAWSPDGKRIAFSATPLRQRDIYVVSSTGGAPLRLTRNASDNAGPSWSREGRWLYFHSNRSGRYEVWRMPSEGGLATQVTHGGGMDPQVSPDGKFIYYLRRGGLWRLPLSGGPESQILESVSQFNNSFPVENGVFFVAAALAENGKEHGYSKICFYDSITGRVREVVAVPGPLSWGLSVSPNRRKFLVTRLKAGESDLRFIGRL